MSRKLTSSSLLPAMSRFAVLLVIIILGCVIDPSFLSLRNIGNNLANASILVILGVGETIAIVTNGPDLSAGSIMTMGKRSTRWAAASSVVGGLRGSFESGKDYRVGRAAHGILIGIGKSAEGSRYPPDKR